jgi:hypothetical protein
VTSASVSGSCRDARPSSSGDETSCPMAVFCTPAGFGEQQTPPVSAHLAMVASRRVATACLTRPGAPGCLGSLYR